MDSACDPDAWKVYVGSWNARIPHWCGGTPFSSTIRLPSLWWPVLYATLKSMTELRIYQTRGDEKQEGILMVVVGSRVSMAEAVDVTSNLTTEIDSGARIVSKCGSLTHAGDAALRWYYWYPCTMNVRSFPVVKMKSTKVKGTVKGSGTS